MGLTEGFLLGGRVRYSQPTDGFRSGLEPVLLAASIPARHGENVLEAGTGAGAALLCLASRVSGISGTGVEADAALADLAAANMAANGFTAVRLLAGRIENVDLDGTFDHAMANPPYHAPAGPVSPNAGKALAKQGSAALLDSWIGRLGAVLRPSGTLTLIVASGMLANCVAAMTGHGCPCVAIYPLWPKAGRAAKLVLLRGIRQSRAPLRLLPGLVLHQSDGGFTDAAQAILRDGASLSLEAQAARGRREPQA